MISWTSSVPYFIYNFITFGLASLWFVWLRLYLFKELITDELSSLFLCFPFQRFLLCSWTFLFICQFQGRAVCFLASSRSWNVSLEIALLLLLFHFYRHAELWASLLELPLLYPESSGKLYFLVLLDFLPDLFNVIQDRTVESCVSPRVLSYGSFSCDWLLALPYVDFDNV